MPADDEVCHSQEHDDSSPSPMETQVHETYIDLDYPTANHKDALDRKQNLRAALYLCLMDCSIFLDCPAEPVWSMLKLMS